MGLNIAPAFRILANSEDITAAIRDRFKSMRLTDETGTTSDTVEITLADHDPANPIAVPPTGAELEVFIGYDDQAQRMGLFVVAVVQRLMDAVFAPVIDQAVAGNLVEPGTKSRPTVWLTAAADQAQPGFLIDLLGKFRPAAQPQQKPVQALTVARVQNLERRAVALAIKGQ